MNLQDLSLKSERLLNSKEGLCRRKLNVVGIYIFFEKVKLDYDKGDWALPTPQFRGFHNVVCLRLLMKLLRLFLMFGNFEES